MSQIRRPSDPMAATSSTGKGLNVADSHRNAPLGDVKASPLSHLPPGHRTSPESADLRRLSALVCHPWMGFGGSEATTMWAIQALQASGAEVTFVTASDFDPNKFNRIYGTQVDASRLNFQRAPRLPGMRNGAQLAHLQSGYFQRYCRELAPHFDLCISGYNLIDFGRPGIQLIGDYTWSEDLRRELDPDANLRGRHRNHLIRRLYLSLGDWLRGDRSRPLNARGDLVLANSAWTRDILASNSLGMRDCPVVFPPVMYVPVGNPDATDKAGREPYSFACLGRITPEKRIEAIIRILARVREAGFPVTLDIAGVADDQAYGESIAQLAAAQGEWIRLRGFLASAERDALLATTAFGLHARPAEAFGIAVAEMAGSGCIPFVPDCGGPAEIVDDPALRFSTETEAVEKILAVLAHPESHDDLRQSLSKSMARYRPEQFMVSFLDQVERFLEEMPAEQQSAA